MNIELMHWLEQHNLKLIRVDHFSNPTGTVTIVVCDDYVEKRRKTYIGASNVKYNMDKETLRVLQYGNKITEDSFRTEIFRDASQKYNQ